jgi:hypothetical protein
MARSDAVDDQLWIRFHELVNMPSRELRDFHGASQEVLNDFRAEPDLDLPEVSRHVLGLLSKRKTDMNRSDEDVMRIVADQIEAWLENPPDDGVANDQWRHSLMMLGHDPLREVPVYETERRQP